MLNTKAMAGFLLALYVVAFTILNSTEVAANPPLRNVNREIPPIPVRETTRQPERAIPPRTTRSLPTRPPIYCRDHHDHYFVAHPSNSQAYYWCFKGNSYQGLCPEGERFYEDEQICFLPPTPASRDLPGWWS